MLLAKHPRHRPEWALTPLKRARSTLCTPIREFLLLGDSGGGRWRRSRGGSWKHGDDDNLVSSVADRKSAFAALE